MTYRHALQYVVLCLLCLTVGCHRDADSDLASGDGLSAAIVPGADLILHVDYREMAGSPVLEKLKAKQTAATPAPSGRWAKFIETTGLGADSLEGLLISMDLDSIDLSSDESRDQRMEGASAVFAASLDSQLTLEDIVAGVEAANADGGKATASIDETQGTGMVRIEVQEETGTQVIYGAPSSQGDTVYFSMNLASLQGALGREASGVTESIPSSLDLAQTALSPDAQLRMALLAPASWRAKIREQVDAPQSAGMVGGMLSPLKNIQSIALGMSFDAELEVQLVGDLGEEAAAQQASAFLQMMVLPMLQSAIAEGGAPGDGEKLNVGVEGTVLRLGMRFSEADIAAFQEKASMMSPAAAGMGGGPY